MLVGLVVLPAPADSADPADKSHEWSIELTVFDQHGKSIAGAWAECTTIMVWDRDEPFQAKANVALGTDSEGKADSYSTKTPASKRRSARL